MSWSVVPREAGMVKGAACVYVCLYICMSGGGVGEAEVGVVKRVDERWVIGRVECQKWTNQGAKIWTLDGDLMLFLEEAPT